MNAKVDFLDRLTLLTERYLTRRKRILRTRREKQKNKNIIIDWLESFIWAAGMVLLINQYLLQAYAIPSGSMIDTLRIKDHIFVNKLVFGPELLPGLIKLPSPFKPKRNDVIIFENPSYSSRGPAFDIAQRIIYMLTLSLVNIDTDESGEPNVHLLIKRAVGTAGDTFILDKGEFRIRFAGEDRFVNERDFNAGRGFEHNLSRLMDADAYPALAAVGKATAYRNLGMRVDQKLIDEAMQINTFAYKDYFAQEQSRLATLRKIQPYNTQYRMLLSRLRSGWYVPEGRILPLGDNRDNSRDGRYFGPVSHSKILGKGGLIFWPFSRIGLIR
ncbi:MAG: S26 family signal peptidase [Spirochaetaceae bacterium]|jgi:signal peptidase I|nr:S26 family signal peptidase [Spirochaetaceae bacterium]